MQWSAASISCLGLTATAHAHCRTSIARASNWRLLCHLIRPDDRPPFLHPVAALAPLLHAFQFVADLGNHQVIDGDAVHIHQQERVVRQEGKRAYFMPAEADK